RHLVLAEFGVATAGESQESIFRGVRASPAWAQAALGEVLERLGRLPQRVVQVTIFSVDPAARLPTRRWSWAWTPAMYAMLSEWQTAPRKWRRTGFHRYDLASYPVGRDVLYNRTPDFKLYYRRLSSANPDGRPLFRE